MGRGELVDGENVMPGEEGSRSEGSKRRRRRRAGGEWEKGAATRGHQAAVGENICVMSDSKRRKQEIQRGGEKPKRRRRLSSGTWAGWCWLGVVYYFFIPRGKTRNKRGGRGEGPARGQATGHLVWGEIRVMSDSMHNLVTSTNLYYM